MPDRPEVVCVIQKIRIFTASNGGFYLQSCSLRAFCQRGLLTRCVYRCRLGRCPLSVLDITVSFAGRSLMHQIVKVMIVSVSFFCSFDQFRFCRLRTVDVAQKN